MAVLARSEHPRGRAAAAWLGRRAAAHLARLGRTGADVSLLLVTDRAMRGLNRRWRGVDRPTDVLSFPVPDPPAGGPLLGDVVICLDMAARRSRAEGRELRAELDRYLAHGLLHLLGYDHERPGDARRMARRERELTRDEGLSEAALRRR